MSGSAFRMGEGDWICSDPQCANINFARRTQCNRCGSDKSEALNKRKLGQEIGKAAAAKSHGLFSADDWQCNKCGNVNWARRQQCNVCNAPRFGDVEERTGLGGGYNDRGVVEYKQRNDSDDEYDEFGRRKKKLKRSDGGSECKSNGKASVSSKEEKPPEKESRSREEKEKDEEEEEEEEDDDEDGDLSKCRMDKKQPPASYRYKKSEFLKIFSRESKIRLLLVTFGVASLITGFMFYGSLFETYQFRKAHEFASYIETQSLLQKKSEANETIFKNTTV